jgi:hypothetical protein
MIQYIPDNHNIYIYIRLFKCYLVFSPLSLSSSHLVFKILVKIKKKNYKYTGNTYILKIIFLSNGNQNLIFDAFEI